MENYIPLRIHALFLPKTEINNIIIHFRQKNPFLDQTLPISDNLNNVNSVDRL
jgi:hypothetical protein